MQAVLKSKLLKTEWKDLRCFYLWFFFYDVSSLSDNIRKTFRFICVSAEFVSCALLIILSISSKPTWGLNVAINMYLWWGIMGKVIKLGVMNKVLSGWSAINLHLTFTHIYLSYAFFVLVLAKSIAPTLRLRRITPELCSSSFTRSSWRLAKSNTRIWWFPSTTCKLMLI